MPNLFEVPRGYEKRMQILKAIADVSTSESLDCITVNSICNQARISRGTFYRYFTDKYEALNWYHMTLESDTVVEIGRTLTFHEGSLLMNQKLYSERAFYSKIYRNEVSELLQLGSRMNYETLLSTMVNWNHTNVTPQLEYELCYWSSAIYSIMCTWIRQGYPQSPELLTDYMDDIRPRLLTRVVDEPVLIRRKTESTSNRATIAM